MSKNLTYQCLNCGEKFIASILSEQEQREYREQKLPYKPVRCPKCGRSDLRQQ
ncbi:MAG: zinc-ribbon domain containing protein [Bradyrhizobium sp.]|uniref:zinc-ribbon domain containing protein n=1 Tax=Bradyrhizobium sp. TaxID=376 RepID=UPI00345C4216|nr:zinc-ribbon domain containing protein [Bradyrhizobium sp.]